MRGPFTYSDLYKSRKSVLVFITNSAYKLWNSCSKWFFIGPRLAYNICRIFEYSWCEHSSKISIPTLIASEIVDLSGYVFWRTSFSEKLSPYPACLELWRTRYLLIGDFGILKKYRLSVMTQASMWFCLLAKVIITPHL